MSKIKLTKGELKRQRDALKRYSQYLPTLQLKKQQLQMKVLEARRERDDRQKIWQEAVDNIGEWAGLLADGSIDLTKWITPTKVEVKNANIAGANVPYLDQIYFETPDYDFYLTPFWIDKALEELRLMVEKKVEVDVAKKRIAILEKELRTTTQRVNLFEKVKIPESRENIRKIGIYLGDQMANAVGVSKVAKKKIEQRQESEEEELAIV